MEQPKTNPEEIKQKTPESQEKKEISIEDIDKVLDIEEGILDSLNKFSKDEIFKNVDFKDTLRFKGIGVIDEKFDEIAYGKATLEQKILNFATLGLAKKDIGLMKSKERGLLNKDVFNKDIEGKDIEIGQNKEERSATEKLIGGFHKELSPEDLEKRQIIKKFEVVDGKIIKIVQTSRTEQGMIDAAGKLRDEKIKEADNFGGDLIKSKEQLEKHLSDKGKLENLKYLSAEGKEDLRIKMAEEEANIGNLIKDKKTELTDKLSIFKEPLEERLNQTEELWNMVSKTLDEVKEESLTLFNSLKEINSEIKTIEKSNILNESKKQAIDNLMVAKNEMDNNLFELVKRKTELEKRNNILLINKRDLSEELSKINKIGKTKKEILEEKAGKEKADKKTGKNIPEQSAEEEKKETAKKSSGTDFAEDWSFMSEGKKDKEKNEPKKYSEEDKKEDEDVEINGVEKVERREFSKKELEEINRVVLNHLKTRGFENIKTEKEKILVIKESVYGVKEILAKSERPVIENNIKDAISEYIKIGGNSRDKKNYLAWKYWKK